MLDWLWRDRGRDFSREEIEKRFGGELEWDKDGCDGGFFADGEQRDWPDSFFGRGGMGSRGDAEGNVELIMDN
jgi:hypothetical protein